MLRFVLASLVFSTFSLSAGDIHKACLIGDLKKVKELVETDKSLVDKVDRVYQGGSICVLTSLHCAVLGGQYEVAKYLLKKGAKVDVFCGESLKYITPLGLAALRDNKKIVSLLILYGADPYIKHSKGKSAQECVKDANINSWFTAWGEAAGKKPHKPKQQLLSCKRAGITRLSGFFSFKRKKKQLKLRLLHNAVAFKHVNAVERIKKQLKLRLYEAAIHGRIFAIEELIRLGVDVNELGPTGKTPLHNAVIFEHVKAVEVLLKAGANPNIKNKDGKLPEEHVLATKKIKALIRNARLVWFLKKKIVGDYNFHDLMRDKEACSKSDYEKMFALLYKKSKSKK